MFILCDWRVACSRCWCRGVGVEESGVYSTHVASKGRVLTKWRLVNQSVPVSIVAPSPPILIRPDRVLILVNTSSSRPRRGVMTHIGEEPSLAMKAFHGQRRCSWKSSTSGGSYGRVWNEIQTRDSPRHCVCWRQYCQGKVKASNAALRTQIFELGMSVSISQE